ncbi:MAG: 4Fe-4S ferredoxin [Trueperaceae bacterium]|nr:MAG: 4Fe-4S ferredoxin [Trueperaceae bacterium]
MIELPRATTAPRPDTPTGFDLFRLPGLRRFARWRYARLALQLPLLLLALFVIVDGLTGRQLAPRNVATTSVWLHYRGFVVLGLAFLGNAFCAACPLMLVRGPSRVLKRWLGREWRWPRALRSKGFVIVLMLAFFFAYEAFSLWSSPWLTAWLVIGYFVAALAVDVLFPPGTFCKHVCPLGTFNFALSHTSPTQVTTVDADVCDRCEHKPCLHGRVSDHEGARAAWEARGLGAEGARRPAFIPLAEVTGANGRGRFPGCETDLFVPAMTSTMDCTLCLNCVRACPYDNVALRVRAPWREALAGAWRRRGGVSLAVLAIVLLWAGVMNAVAMIPPFFAAADAVATTLGTRNETLVLGLLFTLVIGVGGALTLGAFALGSLAAGVREGPRALLLRWGSVAMVLAVGFWTAHYLFHFLTGALTIVPVFQHFFEYRGFAVDTNWRLAQLVPSRWLFFVGAGIASIYGLMAIVVGGARALRDFGATRGVVAMWPIGLFALAVTVLQVVVLAQPMEMRGTLLGPLGPLP